MEKQLSAALIGGLTREGETRYSGSFTSQAGVSQQFCQPAQTAHVGPVSLAGATFSVSATPVASPYDAAAFTASGIDYVAVGNVKSFPKIGSRRNVSQWTPISGDTTNIVSAPTFGSGDMVIADIPSDAGNVILKAAETGTSGQPYNLAMKITFSDGEVMYLLLLISSYEYSFGDNGAVKEITATVNVQKRPVVVAAP